MGCFSDKSNIEKNITPNIKKTNDTENAILKKKIMVKMKMIMMMMQKDMKLVRVIKMEKKEKMVQLDMKMVIIIKVKKKEEKGMEKEQNIIKMMK